MPWRRPALALALCLTLGAAHAAPDALRLNTLLTEQRYAAVRAELDALLRAPQPDASQRELIYRWLFARDDGAGIDRRTRGVLGDERAYTASDDMGDIEERSKWVVVACLRWR